MTYARPLIGRLIWFFGSTALAILPSSSIVLAAGNDEVKPPLAIDKSRAPLVTVVEARRITFVDNVLVTGSLIAREEVLAGAEIDGYRISAILAEEGDVVKEGQVLAKLSRETLEAQASQNEAQASRAQAAIDQARSQISESEASLRQADDAFNRIKALRESGAASQATYDDRELAYRSARARLAAQKDGLKVAESDLLLNKAQRRELDVKLAHTEIKAPAAGLISRRTARIGAVSSVGGDAMFRIIRDSDIELDAEVPEFYMTKLKAGQRATVELTGTGERTGTVRLVSSEVNTSSRLGRVRISLGNDPTLRIGTFARAVIDAGQRDAVGVPISSVLYQNETATVLVVRDGKVIERQVKTGLLTGERVEIRDGLKTGEIVVMRAGSLLRSGDTINPQFIEQRTASEIKLPVEVKP